VEKSAHNSIRPWRDIARELAREPDRFKRRALMFELNRTFDGRAATCAICNSYCELTTCMTDEQGRPVHEQCYIVKFSKTAS
jgi:hypothetical protein